ncbi:Tripartite motif-containing protein 59 [Holothuria leucospilota]|uniref:Tripartite motif-containing protein 59 n=1 Tax=Holothuria leucospilota TaxID=206669 RepID=A0A9Q1CP97_HOLLE|nr:Tripartite motif-containing protein 59 [Holothuria leucospilota]
MLQFTTPLKTMLPFERLSRVIHEIAKFTPTYSMQCTCMMAASGCLPLKCSMCLEDFFQLKIISCGHSFCLRCLNDRTKRRWFSSTRTLQCPQCHITVGLPPSGSFEDLPTSYAISVAPENNQNENVCPLHTKPQDRFCNTCKVCICIDCVEQDHKQDLEGIYHDVTYCINKANYIIDQLTLVVRGLQIPKYEALLKKVSETETNQTENVRCIKEIIRQRRDEMIHEIRHQSDELEMVVDMLDNSKKEKISEIKEDPHLTQYNQKKEIAEKCLSQVREIRNNGLTQAQYEVSNDLLLENEERLQKAKKNNTPWLLFSTPKKHSTECGTTDFFSK